MEVVEAIQWQTPGDHPAAEFLYVLQPGDWVATNADGQVTVYPDNVFRRWFDAYGRFHEDF